ncbi:MAG: hypothetical protein WKF94_13395 [Solirubrobacteraceae bacterium]
MLLSRAPRRAGLERERREPVLAWVEVDRLDADDLQALGGGGVRSRAGVVGRGGFGAQAACLAQLGENNSCGP